MSKQFRDTFKEFIPTLCKCHSTNTNDWDVTAVRKAVIGEPKNQNNTGTGKQVNNTIPTRFTIFVKGKRFSHFNKISKNG